MLETHLDANVVQRESKVVGDLAAHAVHNGRGVSSFRSFLFKVGEEAKQWPKENNNETNLTMIVSLFSAS